MTHLAIDKVCHFHSRFSKYICINVSKVYNIAFVGFNVLIEFGLD